VSVSTAAEAAVACLGIGADDDVLIVCNAEQRAIADALASAASGRARAVRAVEFVPLGRHGEEPPAEIAASMLEASVVFAPTAFSLSHTQARIAATARGARVATMPTITEEIFTRTVPVDYAELKREGTRLASLLTGASSARVTSPGGTDIVLSLEGRTGHSDDGNLAEAGAFGNLPAGEGYIAPVETVGTGTIVFDGSLAGYGLLSEPARITVVDGRAESAEGEAGEWLLRTLDSGGETGRSIAELGIGTNPAATLTGNILEDEKMIGTIHLAFGTSASLGGVNVSTVHIDGLVLSPRVELDGEVVVGG
jgi:aminopeptidase